jgi:phospholipid/cholesterol/gamma-HCH transport system substrate-binding protein
VFLALQSANLLSLNFQSTYGLRRVSTTSAAQAQGGGQERRRGGGRVESITFDDKTFQAR